MKLVKFSLFNLLSCILSLSCPVKSEGSENISSGSLFLLSCFLYLFSFLLVLVSCGSSAFAQVYLPPYDLVYEDLLYLQLDGLLSGLDLNQTPVVSDQLIAAARRDLRSDKLTSTRKFILNRIRNSYVYGDTGSSPGILNRLLEKVFVNQTTEPKFLIGLRTDLEANNEPGKIYPQLRTFGAAILPYGISVVNVMTLDPYATDQPDSRAGNPNYIGKEWHGLSGYTEQAYFLWQTKFSRLTFGRSYILTGPGRNGNLMFSGAARPMDQLRIEFFLKYFSFQSVFAQLDQMDGANRYLNSHRLTLFINGFRFSLTETLLYGGKDKQLELTFLNPFLFYHGEQLNGPNLLGNTLGSLEITYVGSRWRVYTELLIDDIQLDKQEPGDLEPNEIGVLAGFDLADPFGVEGLYLGLEYTALTNRTYKTANPYEWYLHRNVPIGYTEGSDLDCWDLLIKKYLKNWQLIGSIDYLRCGEGEMDQPWDQPWMNYTVAQGYDEPFPTGVVEKTTDLSLEIRWLPSYNYYGFFKVNYQSIQNFDHTTKNKQNLILTLGLHCNFQE